MGQMYVSRGQYAGYQTILKGATNYEVDANVDFNGFDILDIDDIDSNVSGRSINSEATGYDIVLESGAVLDIIINSATEYTFSASTLDLGQNILSNVALIEGITTSNDIDDTTAGWLYKVGAGDTHRFEANGSVRFEVGDNTIGFYGATPAAKPTVTGSRGGNAALADLLTELATLGLITDSSSA